MGMTVTLVHVHVKQEHVAEFIAATRENHRHAVNERGNLRFDVLQSAEQPTHFILYEAYASEADAARHKETRHYLAWRDQVAGWMAEPRRGQRFIGLEPAPARTTPELFPAHAQDCPEVGE